MTVRWPCFVSECLHAYRKYIIIFPPQACRLPTTQIMHCNWKTQPRKLKRVFIYIYKDQHGIFQQMWVLRGHCSSHSQLTLGISECASNCHKWWPRCQATETNGHSVYLHYSETVNSVFIAFKYILAKYVPKSQFYILPVWPWVSCLTSLSLMVLICEIGIIMVSSIKCCLLKHVNHLAQSLAHGI